MSWIWVIVLGVLVIGIVIFIYRQVVAATTEIAVTSQRIVLKTGWLRISTEELALRSIEEVNVSQSFIGRLFNHGSIRVSGTGEGVVAFPDVQAPLELRTAISDARAALRRYRR
ncbi:MAG: PH domain-containing protein [Myxococcota bacterium]